MWNDEANILKVTPHFSLHSARFLQATLTPISNRGHYSQIDISVCFSSCVFYAIEFYVI